jgi:ORF6N domain-containing protein
MFQLNDEELENWRSQIVTSNPRAKMGLRRPPHAFTEHGVAMLSPVLTSKRAVELNILIIRAFVRLRE